MTEKITTTRRRFVKGACAATAIGMVGAPFVALGAVRSVVVVGGGSGGATAAKYLRLADPTLDVTLIEPKRRYYTCCMSNEVLRGERTIDSLRFGYEGLRAHGIKLVQDRATLIDPDAQRITTANGGEFGYDRCILAPGIDFHWDTIEGYNLSVAERIPHAWTAGSQTLTLRKQLEEMPNGGTVVIAAPPDPARCPSGPYERASLIAAYLKRHKPRSKVLILDAKSRFPAQKHFLQGWKALYGYGSENAMIEWRPSDPGGRENAVIGVDAGSAVVTTGSGERVKGDVLNLIPAQKSGRIAIDSGLANAEGWCPVDLHSFESTLLGKIHVIGDAAIANDLPKSAYAANSAAKICAAGVLALFDGRQTASPACVNTCYAILGEAWGLSMTALYRLAEQGKRMQAVSGGITPMDATPEMRRREVAYAHGWFTNLTHDIFM